LSGLFQAAFIKEGATVAEILQSTKSQLSAKRVKKKKELINY
jgi:hypothetical protein